MRMCTSSHIDALLTHVTAANIAQIVQSGWLDRLVAWGKSNSSDVRLQVASALHNLLESGMHVHMGKKSTYQYFSFWNNYNKNSNDIFHLLESGMHLQKHTSFSSSKYKYILIFFIYMIFSSSKYSNNIITYFFYIYFEFWLYVRLIGVVL